MRKILFIPLFALLTACNSLPVNECAFDQETFCLGQVALENRLNGLLDSAGSRSCVDVVHTCPNKAQCAFSGCGVSGSEAGDWVVEQVVDPRR